MTIISIILFLFGGLLLLGAKTEISKRKKRGGKDLKDKPLTGVFVFAIISIILGWLIWPSPEDKNKGEVSHLATSHQDSIKLLFNEWNGTDIALVDLVKQNMNDADSFENVDTKYFDMGSYIVINMKYRGKNVFGAKVLNFVKARQNIDGSGLEIIETQP